MIDFKIIKSFKDFDENLQTQMLIEFLYLHLDRFRDSREAITACLEYAMSDMAAKGGFVVLALENNEIAGAVVMINTGMKYYIPEYFLVYIAVHAQKRNKGLGRKLLEKVISMVEGDIALHVEYDNPAKRLYEKVGFKSKYAEMRYNREE